MPLSNVSRRVQPFHYISALIRNQNGPSGTLLVLSEASAVLFGFVLLKHDPPGRLSRVSCWRYAG
jgi:hypothetical protein